jgi:hypothetical protein
LHTRQSVMRRFWTAFRALTSSFYQCIVWVVTSSSNTNVGLFVMVGMLPFLASSLGWVVRKANWLQLSSLLPCPTAYDVVVWLWKLVPFGCSTALRHHPNFEFPSHVIAFVSTLIAWRLWRMLRPQGRAGSVAGATFWSFFVVLALQGYLIAVESQTAVSLPPRFTVAFAFVFLCMLFFVCVVVGLLVVAGRALWLGPGVTVAKGRRRSFHKSSLTANIWVEDFDQYGLHRRR